MTKFVAVVAASAVVGVFGYNETSPLRNNVECAVVGKTFTQAKPNLTRPNGGFTADAKACQTTCKDIPYCEHFSWHAKTHEFRTPGACFLYGNTAVEAVDEGAISGPAVCGKEKATVITDGAAATPTVTSGAETPTVITATNTTKTLVGSETKAGGVPLWGIVAAGLGAAVVGAGAFAAMGGVEKKKKTKRSLKTEEGGPKTASQLYSKMILGEDAETGYSMTPDAQMVQMQQAPMYYSSYTSVPVQYAPVTGSTAGAPQYYYTSQGPAEYVPAQVEYVQAPMEYVQVDANGQPMQYMPVQAPMEPMQVQYVAQ